MTTKNSIFQWPEEGFKCEPPAYRNYYIAHKAIGLNMVNEFEVPTAQKMKFSIKDFFSKWDQIRRFLRIGHICWKNP